MTGIFILAASAGSVGKYIEIVFEKNFSPSRLHGDTILS